MTPREPMTGACPTCGAPAGTCVESRRKFALYDVLYCAAMAVDEYESGSPAKAETAWFEASFAASGLFAPGSTKDAAITVILDAARPGHGTEVPSRLWMALGAAASAIDAALEGDRVRTASLVPSAVALAAALDREVCGALIEILGEARRMAAAGTGVRP